MTLVIPPGFAQAALQFRHTSDPDPWYITYGFDGSGLISDPPEVGAIIGSYWADFIDDLVSSDVTCTGVKLTIGQDAADNLVVFVPLNIAGGSPSARLPQNCALLVDKSTQLGGRKGRGRFFIPGVLAESEVSSVGVIDSTYLAGIQIACNQVLNAHNDGINPDPPVPMVLLHNADGADTPVPTPITLLTAQQLISTQRRRLR